MSPIKVNRSYLRSWGWPILSSAINGGLVAGGAVAGLSVIAANDINLLSWYNLVLVIKAWCIVFTMGFVGCMITALAKSPLQLNEVFVESVKTTETQTSETVTTSTVEPRPFKESDPKNAIDDHRS